MQHSVAQDYRSRDRHRGVVGDPRGRLSEATLEFVVDGKDMDCLHVHAYGTAAVFTIAGIKQLGVAESLEPSQAPTQIVWQRGAMYDNE